ncbi:MAG: hypothetical protein ACI9R3_001157 [Verrucomicrobiales bacterium]|jgi:hypothetical protein
MAPVFVKTLQIEGTQLAYASGILYVGADTELHSFSIFRNDSGLSAEGLDVLGLSAKITDLAREHQKLYVMQFNREIQVVDIARFDLRPEGSAVFAQGGSTLFVGGGKGYAAAANFGLGGVATFDLADPNAPALISLSDVPGGFLAPKRDVAVSGSGIGMIVGQGSQQDVTLIDLSDPEKTFELLTAYDLSEEAQAVAMASGFGFVANGTAGLRVYNYLAFDALGTPPTVTIDTTALDVDSATPGIQMVESTVVPILTTITDDVQVRDVRLLVDGDPVLVDVAFPMIYRCAFRLSPMPTR